jgi:hypothetical protein
MIKRKFSKTTKSQHTDVDTEFYQDHKTKDFLECENDKF